MIHAADYGIGVIRRTGSERYDLRSLLKKNSYTKYKRKALMVIVSSGL